MIALKEKVLVVLMVATSVFCRIHKLDLLDDVRHYIDLTTFGFYQGGVLDVHLVNFHLPPGPATGTYGFTLDRTLNDAISPYLDIHSDTCILQGVEKSSTLLSAHHPAIVFLKMDFINLSRYQLPANLIMSSVNVRISETFGTGTDFKVMKTIVCTEIVEILTNSERGTIKEINITCVGEVNALHLYQNRSMIPIDRIKRHSQYMFVNRRRRSVDDYVKTYNKLGPQCSYAVLPITKETRNGTDYFNTSFAMYVASNEEEGLYNLYFHNCPPENSETAQPINATILLYESNDGNFLSAGEMPLPALYSMMSLIFLLSAGFWTFILKTSRHKVYRIHIIMCVLVYLKALSLAFHGINYHFIQTRGEHVTAWAILYYITHLLKGAVLFVTIVLVGTGWNFIKHILADRDKKIFMIVIPLQVVANVAEIIIAESEEGAVEHNAWRILFIFVDMVCCGAIMFPVVWSIHHLEDSSTTDGKAAVNLRKLKLFRHFYIIIVCYIYFTRFVISILENTVPFQYSWIDEMFRELGTFVFFVMTGYKFRPAAANPYFTPTLLDDIQPKVLSEIGVLDGVTNREKRREDMQPLMQDTNSD